MDWTVARNGETPQRCNWRFLGLTFFPVIDTLRIALSPLGDSSQRHLTLFPHGKTANVQGSLAQLEVVALRIRQNVGGRSVAETVKSFAALILSCCMSGTMLFAQAPPAPAQRDSSAAKFPAASAYANTKLTYKIIDAPKQTYGYDIFADGRLVIHQTSAPALPGNGGFKTKQDASKIAALVIGKIRKGEMPPTVSIDEMKKLNVIK
jgi:hypothetical protein